MDNTLTRIGIAITFLQTVILILVFLRRQKRPLVLRGWCGLAGLWCAEALLFAGVQPVAIYFTPIAWTCYILLVDTAVLV